jgi:hypothetical protein
MFIPQYACRPAAGERDIGSNRSIVRDTARSKYLEKQFDLRIQRLLKALTTRTAAAPIAANSSKVALPTGAR